MRARQLLSWLHRWLGILVSIWLVLVASTGTLLLYKTEFLQWHYPQLALTELPSFSTAGKVFDTYNSGYAYLPRADKPWIEVIDGAGNTHYHGTNGEHLLTREALSDWIDVAVQFHHHLLLHDLGKDVMGVLSLFTLVILITGVIRWWPKHFNRRIFSVKWHMPWQKGFQMTLFQCHKTFGIVSLPAMLLGVVTGAAIMYAAFVSSSLSTLLPAERPLWGDATYTVAGNASGAQLPPARTWAERFQIAAQVFPDMTPALVSLPVQADGTVSMRLVYNGEWHPNGRSKLSFHAATGELVNQHDTRTSALGFQLSQLIYPVHVAAVGGLAMLVVQIIGGLMLIVMPVTGVWFWLWRRRRR